MKTKTEARERLKKSYLDYEKDMTWLRDKFGIIPDKLEPHTLKKTLKTALMAVASNKRDDIRNTVLEFEKLHSRILYKVAWNLLENSKKNLKSLKEANYKLYETKLRDWNKASWALTADCYRVTATKYKGCIELAAQI